MVERGSQLVSSALAVTLVAYPVRNPAKSIPVFGIAVPLGWSPAVDGVALFAPPKLKLVNRAKFAEFSRYRRISYPNLNACEFLTQVVSLRQEMVSLTLRLGVAPFMP